VAVNVIPAQAGIQSFKRFLDPRLRGRDGSVLFTMWSILFTL